MFKADTTVVIAGKTIELSSVPEANDFPDNWTKVLIAALILEVAALQREVQKLGGDTRSTPGGVVLLGPQS